MQVDSLDGARELDIEQLRCLADEQAEERAGRWASEGDSVAFSSIVDIPTSAFVVFHASDGYAVCLTHAEALASALLVVPPPSTGKVGARLVVTDSERKCTQVKAVIRIELRDSPGTHSVNPNPHRNKHVPGWDPAAPT